MIAITTIKKRTITEINNCHHRIEGMGDQLLEQALYAGQLISEVKADLPHGTFMEWVKENLKFSHKTATNYMRLHDLEQAGKLATVANIGDAYQLIKSPPKIGAPSSEVAKQRPIIIEAEIVEPEAAEEMVSVESLTGTSSETRSRVRAVNRAAEDFDPKDELPEPLADAIDRLVFIIMLHKLSPEYIHGLCEGVLLTEKHNEQEGGSEL